MSEENEDKPTESHSGFTDSSTDVASTLVQIKELQGKIRLLRWGMFIGVLAIMAIGISSIWNTTKRAAKPAVDVYIEAKEVFDGVQDKINIAQADYNRLEPKATKAFDSVKGLMDREGEAWRKLQNAMQDNYDEEIKPAAEHLAKTVLIDIQDQALEKFEEIAAQSDEFLSMAHEEYDRMTNSIPDAVSEALEQTLIKTINEREARMREMFPKLTKEKQSAVISQLSNRLTSFTDEESEKIFIALFADHLSELGKMAESMDTIYTKEGGAAAGTKSGVGTTLALLSSLIEIAMREIDTEDLQEANPPESPKGKGPDNLLKEKPKKKPAPAKDKKPEGEKPEPEKKDPSSDKQ